MVYQGSLVFSSTCNWLVMIQPKLAEKVTIIEVSNSKFQIAPDLALVKKDVAM